VPFADSTAGTCEERDDQEVASAYISSAVHKNCVTLPSLYKPHKDSAFNLNHMTLQEQLQQRKIRRGDIEAFEKLFHRFYPGLCSYAETLVRKYEVAEEVVQDVFYNIWKNRESLMISRSWQSYLYRSVYNNSMMYLRKNRREILLEEGVDTDRERTSSDPDQELQYREISQLVSSTIQELPERTREIFRLNRQEGLRYKEIAERLSISVKTVEANMGRALKALRTSLGKYREE